jgi:RHS repeat-associated protein
MGNITRLVNSTNGVVASYKYDAYGRTISSSGSVVNNFRFSSKLWIYDGTPGFYYFGYRFYEPSLQRWLNRDPLEEQDAPNLYVMVYNNPVNYYDVDGLQASAPPSQPRTPKPKLPTKAPPTPRIPFPKVSLPKPVEKPTIKIGPVGTAIVCGSLIAEAIDVASTIIWPDPDPDPLPVPEKSFKEAKKDCIKECTDETLPTGTLDGAPFFRCMRACMKRAGYNY